MTFLTEAPTVARLRENFQLEVASAEDRRLLVDLAARLAVEPRDGDYPLIDLLRALLERIEVLEGRVDDGR